MRRPPSPTLARLSLLPPAALALVLALVGVLSALAAPPAAADELGDPREVHLADIVQLTDGGENAEGYWSPDGRELLFQSTHEGVLCDQIFRVPADGSAAPVQVSTGGGRTTCSYFTYPEGARILYSTTRYASPDCPAPPDRSEGYVWAVYEGYEIVSALPDGSDVRRLTDSPGYDAEATVCPTDGRVVFTSVRDGDLELYAMAADGSGVTRLTDAPGYDGGAFFSPDCSRIVWRASRPQGEELADYRRLLERGLVRPGRLELWVADADGSDARQLTYLGAASFAPSFFPSGERVIFSSNYSPDAEGARGREFDLWGIDLDGTDLERITFTPEFDGFPLFSPDGSRLAFASNRNQSAPGETNLFVARWVDTGGAAAAAASAERAEDRFLADVAWLAADERQGRGVGGEGIRAARDWLVERFAEIGLAPAGDDDGYLQEIAVTVAVEAGPGTEVAIAGRALPAESFVPAPFSSSGRVMGEVVAAGYGVVDAEHGIDDYAGPHGPIDVEGKIVVVRRFLSPQLEEAIADDDASRRASDLRQKAFSARERGAVGMIVVDLPGEGVEEAPLPALRLESAGHGGADAGLPVVLATGEAAGALFAAGAAPAMAAIAVELARREVPAWNVVGRLAARGGGEGGAAVQAAGTVVVGAHYDHLGMGGSGSLDPDAHEPHNGADDNASGVAALLEAARVLATGSSAGAPLARDVVFVAFSGEESGLLGSSAFVRHPPGGLDLPGMAAMINLDMVGRLRRELSVLGGGSAAEWDEMVPPLCAEAGLTCALGGDGYGPSDQTSFYAAGVPVLHFFTGAHSDYHKPSDDTALINAAGGARVAALTAAVAAAVAGHAGPLTYEQTAAPPPPQGDRRSYGAALGVIPEYAPEKGVSGLPLAGVRAEGPAETAGMRRGDRLIELAGRAIRDVYDLMYVLRESKAGETVQAVVMRDGERLELEVTFGESRGIR